MSDKKQKEAMMKKVKQVLVVGACVLFVILMILSGMSSHWLNIFTVVKPGDTVVVDYTLYDATGDPILTTNQQLAVKGNVTFSDQQLKMVAGQNTTQNITPVSIYTGNSGSANQFALFSMEYNAIDQALIGMKTGDQKHVQIPGGSIAQLWSAESLNTSGIKLSDLRIGDLLPMAVSDQPEEMASNTSVTYSRIGEITKITNESIVVDSGYPAADISIVSINENS